MLDLGSAIQDLHQQRKAFVLVTLVDHRGSSPQDVGAKMIVTEGGLFRGTVGGGKIEAHCIRVAQNMLEEKSVPRLHTWNLQKDIGMTCGGEVSVFFDPQRTRHWNIAIFGAGHVSQEICRLLYNLDCHLTVVDSRAQWLNQIQDYPHVEKVLTNDMASIVDSLSEKTYLISVTQGHATDLPILAAALKKSVSLAYVGAIGSFQKSKKLRQDLKELGFSFETTQRLKCPLGLPLGNNSPAEIAISVVAELLSSRDQSTFQVRDGIVLDKGL